MVAQLKNQGCILGWQRPSLDVVIHSSLRGLKKKEKRINETYAGGESMHQRIKIFFL